MTNWNSTDWDNFTFVKNLSYTIICLDFKELQIDTIYRQRTIQLANLAIIFKK